MVFSIIIPFIIMWGGAILRFKSISLSCEERQSPYECGFSSFSASRRSFSLYFFQLALLFLVFDAEIVILMPMPEMNMTSGTGFSGMVFFIILLVFGLFHEWREGSLERPSW